MQSQYKSVIQFIQQHNNLYAKIESYLVVGQAPSKRHHFNFDFNFVMIECMINELNWTVLSYIITRSHMCD